MNYKEYSVSWNIHVIALSEQDAAYEALSIMQDKSSKNLLFTVTDVQMAEPVQIDLSKE